MILRGLKEMFLEMWRADGSIIPVYLTKILAILVIVLPLMLIVVWIALAWHLIEK